MGRNNMKSGLGDMGHKHGSILTNGPKELSVQDGYLSKHGHFLNGRCFRRAHSETKAYCKDFFSQASTLNDKLKGNNGQTGLAYPTQKTLLHVTDDFSSQSIECFKTLNGQCFRRTKSKSDQYFSKPGKKLGRPKTREDFYKGRIFRWDDFAQAKQVANQNNNIPCSIVSMAMEDSIAIRNAPVTNELKVYSRSKDKSCSKKVLMPKKDCDVSEVGGEKRDNQLLSRKEDSCRSFYYSSSDNSVSDKEALECEEINTEKDREATEEEAFEGVRCLLGSQGAGADMHTTNEDS